MKSYVWAATAAVLVGCASYPTVKTGNGTFSERPGSAPDTVLTTRELAGGTPVGVPQPAPALNRREVEGGPGGQRPAKAARLSREDALERANDGLKVAEKIGLARGPFSYEQVILTTTSELQKGVLPGAFDGELAFTSETLPHDPIWAIQIKGRFVVPPHEGEYGRQTILVDAASGEVFGAGYDSPLPAR